MQGLNPKGIPTWPSMVDENLRAFQTDLEMIDPAYCFIAKNKLFINTFKYL